MGVVSISTPTVISPLPSVGRVDGVRRRHRPFHPLRQSDDVRPRRSRRQDRARCDAHHGAATVVLLLPAARRGWLRMPRVTVETSYPVGLLRAWSYVLPDASALVYPRPEESALPPPAAMPDRGDAAMAGSGNDDYWGLRPYQPSDSPRHIAWKASARGDMLLTKVFVGHGAYELWLDWHTLPDSVGVERRLSLLTHQVLAAEDANVAYGLRLPTSALEPALGESHRDACLKALALFDGPRA
jgi:uncharacterized protein (DUF58 family)